MPKQSDRSTTMLLQPETILGKIQVDQARFAEFSLWVEGELCTLTAKMSRRWPLVPAAPQRQSQWLSGTEFSEEV